MEDTITLFCCKAHTSEDFICSWTLPLNQTLIHQFLMCYKGYQFNIATERCGRMVRSTEDTSLFLFFLTKILKYSVTSAMSCFTNYVHFGVRVKAEKQSRSYLGLQLGRICSRVGDRHSERNAISVCGGFLTFKLNCQPVLALIMPQNAIEHSASA